MGHCKVSQGNAQCPDDSYCDLATSMCEPCHIHCDPLRDTWTNCQRHCPEFYNVTMNKINSTTITQMTTTNNTLISAQVSRDNTTNIALIMALVLGIIIFFFIIVVIMLHIIFKKNFSDVKFFLKKIFCQLYSVMFMKQNRNDQDPENPVCEGNNPEASSVIGHQHNSPLLAKNIDQSNHSNNPCELNTSHEFISESNDSVFSSEAQNQVNDCLTFSKRRNNTTSTGTICSKCSSQQTIQKPEVPVLDHDSHRFTLDSNEKNGERKIESGVKYKHENTNANKKQIHETVKISPTPTNKMTNQESVYENQPVTKPKEKTEKNSKPLDEKQFDFNLYSTIYYPKDDVPGTKMEGIESVHVDSGYKTESGNRKLSVENNEIEFSLQCVDDTGRVPEMQNNHNSGSTLGAVGGAHYDAPVPDGLHSANNQVNDDDSGCGSASDGFNRLNQRMYEELYHPEPPRPVPTNRQLYDMLKRIDWVMGYHSSGHSIEVYVNLGDLDPRDIERQLADRTGAPREKFHVKPNEESSFGFY